MGNIIMMNTTRDSGRPQPGAASMTGPLPELDAYAAEARDWLEANATPRKSAGERSAWGEGSDDVSVFHDLDQDEEAELLRRAMEWQRRKYDAGYGAISWPLELGGAGLPAIYEQVFRDEEAAFETPQGHETFSVTTQLVAPTIRTFGTPEQQARFVPRFLRTEELCCQLFSEPGAGSDLAALKTRAVRDGDEWVITGQKVWSSGARFSTWGEIICRTDFDAPKHAGLTAFLLPMDAPGIEIRPIRQMSGGSSFNEVFFDEVRIPDSLRLGAVGEGWKVTLVTLAFERASSAGEHGDEVGGSWEQVLELARWLGRTDDPVVRQRLARLHTLDRIRSFQTMRQAAEPPTDDGAPSPANSTGKLQWTQWMTMVSDVVSELLGPRLVADTGEWGTYAWAKHVLGAPGYRIAGGSDEIQRNIIGERVLGLPPEPRVDRNVPFSQIGKKSAPSDAPSASAGTT
jgi:alkylation response protein AidB-like acyl-CoA dehydrogenase